MRRVALAVVAAALLGMTPAAGAATLYPSAPNVTVGADGGAAVAWLRADPAGRARAAQVMVSVQAPDGSFGAPEVVAELPSGGADYGPIAVVSSLVRVLRSRGGDVLVTWRRVVSTDGRGISTSEMWGRWRSAAGAWSVPMVLSQPSFSDDAVAMAPGGRTYVIFTPSNGADTQLRTALPNQPFGPSERLAPIVFNPALAATDLGLLLVGQGRASSARLRLARRTPSGRYTSVDLLPTQGNPNIGRVDSGPLIAASSDGTASVAWSQADGFVPSVRVATVAPDATTASMTTALSGGSKITTVHGLARDGAGRVTVLADQQGASSFALMSGADGTYARQDLATQGMAAAALSGDGAGIALWADGSGGVAGAGRMGSGPFAPLPPLRESGRVVVRVAAAIGPVGATIALLDAPGAQQAGQRLVVAELRADAVRRTQLDALTTVADAPAHPRMSTAARLTRSGRLAVTVRCQGVVSCAATVRLHRGQDASSPLLNTRAIRLGAGRSRVYALTVGRPAARAIRARRLTRLSAVVQSPRQRGTTRLRVRTA